MDSTIFGMYDFGNDTLVDLIHRDSGGNVFMHEYTHRVISTFSSMGLLLIMMKKACLLAPEKQWLYEKLMKMIQEVQEITATNVEYYHIYQTKGNDAFKQALCQLGENKEYMRYFNRLYDIHRNIHSEDDAAQLIDMLLALAIGSMNLDFSGFPLWAFQGEEDFVDFWKQSGMRERYHPATRFHILIDYFLRMDHSEAAQAKLQQVSDYSYNENPTQHCFEIACKIYQTSDHFERIKRRISTISIDPDRIEILDKVQAFRLSAYPIDLNGNQHKRVYFPCDLSACVKMLENNPDQLLIFQHVMSGFEDFTMLVCTGSGPEIYLCPYTENDLPTLLSLSNQIVFTRGKLIQKLRPMLWRCKKKPYILMDSGMADNLNFIFRKFENKTYTYLVQDKYVILLIYNDQYTLFQPIVYEALSDAMQLLGQHGIQYIEYGVSGYYGDKIPKLLAKYNRDTASDAFNILQKQEEEALNGKWGLNLFSTVPSQP